MAINPITNPQAYDTVRVGAVESPLCKLGNWKRKYQFDVKKGKGTVGSTTTFVANPPAEGSITFYVWEASQWDQWVAFRNVLAFDPTKAKAQAIDIYHPALVGLGVKSVQTTSIGPETNSDDKGLWSIEVEFIEYRPVPKKDATSTATGSKAVTKVQIPGTPPDPIGDAQQAQIAKLLEQAQKP